MNTIIATISLLATIAWSAPAPAPQTTIEKSSATQRFNLGVSSHRNSLDLSGNLAQIANQKIQALNAVSNAVASPKTAAGTVSQIVAVPPQKFSLLNSVQALAVQQQPSFPDSGRKQAIQERESKQSMVDSLYGYAQQFVAGLFNRKPIVDTIQEKDKYGNDGEKYRNIGVAVVNSFEGLSNFLNSAVEVPFTIMKQVAQKATTALNGVGGKLVGLE